MTFSGEAWEWLSRALTASPSALAVQRMKGSSTSSIYLVETHNDSSAERFVLRVLDNPEWLADEPDLIVHEAAALTQAQAVGLRAPRLVAYSPDDCGFGAPVLLMTFLEGKIELRPANPTEWLRELARELVAIHRCPAGNITWQFNSWVNVEALAVPAWTTVPKVWERAIEFFHKGRPAFQPVFLHRDYHPMNVLWNGGTISGVVDWINACQGPAGVDVAHCRMNLVTMYGLESADEFLRDYCELADGFEYDPYWDVDGVLDVSLPEPMFYDPWLDFGLGQTDRGTLIKRMDEFLGKVLMR